MGREPGPGFYSEIIPVFLASSEPSMSIELGLGLGSSPSTVDKPVFWMTYEQVGVKGHPQGDFTATICCDHPLS